MKTYFAAAALVVSSLALPSAKANSIIFGFTNASQTGTFTNSANGTGDTFSNTGGTGVAVGAYSVKVSAYECGNSAGTAAATCATTSGPENAANKEFATTSITLDNPGLGAAGSSTIENVYYLQVDFSSIASSLKSAGNNITGIKVNVSNIATGWVMYGSNSSGYAETGGQAYATQSYSGFGTVTSETLTQGQVNTLLNGGTYDSISISGAANCHVEISSIEVDYSAAAPEPGTLLLMGGALLGLGVAGKKLRRRA